MKEISYTLLTDGSSDRALIPIINWLLGEHLPEYAIQPQWADLYRLPTVPHGLVSRILTSIDLYPCTIIFIHRDAERENHKTRFAEITEAVETASATKELPRAIGVIPVRLQEAWLLFNESAIRKAAGNPNGKQPLLLPHFTRLEDQPDPKESLYELLRTASGLVGRRLKKLSVPRCAYRVSEFISDFSPLRRLPAFQHLESEVERMIEDLHL